MTQPKIQQKPDYQYINGRLPDVFSFIRDNNIIFSNEFDRRFLAYYILRIYDHESEKYIRIALTHMVDDIDLFYQERKGEFEKGIKNKIHTKEILEILKANKIELSDFSIDTLGIDDQNKGIDVSLLESELLSTPAETKKNSKVQKVENIEELLSKCRLKITDTLKEAPICIEYYQKDNVFTLGTLGNILMIQARGKTGKTYLVSAITASLLSFKKFIGFRGYLPPEKRKVLFFDTEQGKEDAKTTLNRIYKLAEIDSDNEYENFEYYCLRSLTASQRKMLIESKIYSTENLGACIIDGVRDLIPDFNDTGQSFELINSLMQWTDDKMIHIIAVTHQNPNDDKSRGHLGTELTNKAECIISLTKNKEDDSYRTLDSYGRRKSFRPFNYSLDENDCPILSSVAREIGKFDPLKLDIQTHKNIIDEIYKKVPAGHSYSLNGLYPLIANIFNMNYGKDVSDIKCRNLIHHYLSNKILRNEGNEKNMKLVPYK